MAHSRRKNCVLKTRRPRWWRDGHPNGYFSFHSTLRTCRSMTSMSLFPALTSCLCLTFYSIGKPVDFFSDTTECGLNTGSGVGMCVVVDLFEPVDADVRINLRAGKTLVSQQFLHDAQIGPRIKQMRCEGMP